MDEATFAERVERALPRLRSVARRMMHDAHDAEDVVQEAMLKATSARGEHRGEAALETWLHTIVARTAIDHLRARKRFRTQVMIDACDPRAGRALLPIFEDASVSFDVREHIAFCFGCVGRTLEPEESVALVLCEVAGLSNDEAARACGVTESVLRHRLSVARASMTAEFEGLCALVRKDGPCHQCSTLRELAPEGRRGPALPAMPLSLDDRLAITREASIDGTAYDALRAHFEAVSRAMNDSI